MGDEAESGDSSWRQPRNHLSFKGLLKGKCTKCGVTASEWREESHNG